VAMHYLWAGGGVFSAGTTPGAVQTRDAHEGRAPGARLWNSGRGRPGEQLGLCLALASSAPRGPIFMLNPALLGRARASQSCWARAAMAANQQWQPAQL
jgi:hypothetical protein